jgi:hypothetical protein
VGDHARQIWAENLRRQSFGTAANFHHVPVGLGQIGAHADIYFMPVPIRTALLTVAALAAVGIAAARITSAAEHRSFAAESTPHREVTPDQAAATLARFAPPPGFRPVRQCRFQDASFAAKCFWTPRALPIDAPAVRRLSRSWGLQALGRPFLDGCSGPRDWREGMVIRHCNWALEAGPELVDAAADSLSVPPGRARTRFARKALRYWRSGTELRLTVIGHWPHDKGPTQSDFHL